MPQTRNPNYWSSSFSEGVQDSILGDWFGFNFRTPATVEKFKRGEIVAYCKFCHGTFEYKDTVEASSTSNSSNRPSQSIEDRLKELQNLKSKGLVSEEEYEAKRKELLRSL